MLSGTIYGLLVYGVMNYIVLPMSAGEVGLEGSDGIGLSIVVHMFLIGVPCAVFAPSRRPGKPICVMSRWAVLRPEPGKCGAV